MFQNVIIVIWLKYLLLGFLTLEWPNPTNDLIIQDSLRTNSPPPRLLSSCTISFAISSLYIFIFLHSLFSFHPSSHMYSLHLLSHLSPLFFISFFYIFFISLLLEIGCLPVHRWSLLFLRLSFHHHLFLLLYLSH